MNAYAAFRESDTRGDLEAPTATALSYRLMRPSENPLIKETPMA